jgi:hypothetical protein
MKTNCHASRRIKLGRVSIATLGSTFGAIEQVGLYQVRRGFADR